MNDLKIIIILTALMFSNINSFAQPTDNCSNQTVPNGELTIDFNGKTDSGLTPGSCVGNNYTDVYARGIVGPSGNLSLTWDTDYQGAVPVVTVYTGGCGNLSEEDCHTFTTWGTDVTWSGSGFTPGDTVTYRFTAHNVNIVAVFNAIGLPLKIGDLYGKPVGMTNEIGLEYWSARNVDYAEVEQSKDGRSFSAIGKVDILNKNGQQNITFIDKHPYKKTFYRFKIIDMDGNYKCSKIISVINENIKSETILIYPNPANNNIIINSIKETKIKIFNRFGTMIRKVHLNSGNNKIDISELQTGMYYIKSENGVIVKVMKSNN